MIDELKQLGIIGYSVDLTNLPELLEVAKLISAKYHQILIVHKGQVCSKVAKIFEILFKNYSQLLRELKKVR